jgi:predicted RNA binding protein YcfA (HicA-like mRNA interferase family)
LSPRLSSVKPRQLVRILEREGWILHRQRGSHAHFKKEGRAYLVTVVMHNRDIAPGTLRGILADAELSEERFIELLNS